MAILTSRKIEQDAVEMGASLMALSARTAPKGRGVDSVKTLILTGNDLEQLAVRKLKGFVFPKFQWLPHSPVFFPPSPQYANPTDVSSSPCLMAEFQISHFFS